MKSRILIVEDESEELENRVRERTASLEQRNQELEREIADRKNVERALRQSEEWYRALVENSSDGIAVQKDSKIIFANSHLCDMLGYSQGELEGLDYWAIFHPEYQEIARAGGATRIGGQDVLPHHEVKLQRKDGSTLDAEIRARAVKVKGEQGTQVWVRDVSLQKRSREVQRRLATAVEQAAEAIVITDTGGIIQYVNPAFETITGYTAEESVGKNPKLLKSGEHDSNFYANLWETITRGQVWKGQFINKKKEGTLYNEECTISPVRDQEGQIVNFVAVKRDITEHLELSRRLLHAQKMEAIGTLAGGIAHDFNNVLQIVLGYSELMLAEKQEDDPEYQDLSKILQSAGSGAELVQGLLTFSRKVEPKPFILNLNTRIGHVEKLLRRTIPRMIDIQMDLSDNLRQVQADPSQMEQVLMNLAVNARDAMPDKGTLAISTRNVTLNEEYCRSHAEAKPGRYVQLSVSDTGHGMDESTIEHIFEPFFTTKESGRGTGLGLAMVYGIVKQHGGHISCKSKVGHGTTFEVYFPAIEGRAETDTQKTELMPALGTETILFVDDEEFVRDLGVRILGAAGYRVVTAANGVEALDLFERERNQTSLVLLDLIMPDIGGKAGSNALETEKTKTSLVILDLIMPDMGGIECLKKLRKIDPNLKILITSGLYTEPSIKEFVEIGATGFVSKPFKKEELLRRVRKMLDER